MTDESSVIQGRKKPAYNKSFVTGVPTRANIYMLKYLYNDKNILFE